MNSKILQSILLITLLGISISCQYSKRLTTPQKTIDQQPNVLIIMIDDLNDCIETYDGHPQSLTPHLSQFVSTATQFERAYTNAPMCGPSRASLFTGILPHQSGLFYQSPWHQNEVLQNSKTMMQHFKEQGYNVLGSGKLLHHLQVKNWTHFEHPADYSPTPFDGEERLAHPDVPEPFSDIGWVDGSIGPFINLETRKSKTGKQLQWITGNPKSGFKPMRYINDEDRDPTPDEINAAWAEQTIHDLETQEDEHPFFLAVGFLRPHTPLVAPQKYFDRFPLDDIQLTIVRKNDKADTHLEVAYKDGDVHALRFGKDMFDAISQAYGSTQAGLKRWTQAYLACVAAVDDNVGQVIKALDNSKFRENTIVVIASDHGFHMGEKDYLYKNSLWEESTRIPLLMRIPQLSESARVVTETVSLIDIYPTLLDLCQLQAPNVKNDKGKQLDGQSLMPLFKSSGNTGFVNKPALTAVYSGDQFNSQSSDQHYAIRTDQFRYILYNTGHEELYDHDVDPHEWTNVAENNQSYSGIKHDMRQALKELVAPIELNAFLKLKE